MPSRRRTRTRSTPSRARTPNADDSILTSETEGSDSDPLVEYALLGDGVTDGVFGWVTIAVNVPASYDPTYGFVRKAEGGVQECGGSQAAARCPTIRARLRPRSPPVAWGVALGPLVGVERVFPGRERGEC